MRIETLNPCRADYTFWLLLVLLLATSLIACSPEVPALEQGPATAVDTSTPVRETPPAEAVEGSASTPTSLPTATSAAAEPDTAADGATPSPEQAMIVLAQADLAQRLDLDPDEIGVVDAIETEWPDASLGCAAPGGMYMQVITPGYLIVLEADGQRYEYHTDTRGTVALCTEEGLPSLPDLPVDPTKIKDGIPWMPVD